MDVPVIPQKCVVRDCPSKPQIKEVYDRPLVYVGGDTDYVCSGHTDRFGGQFAMLAKEVLPGEVIYQLEGAST